ncbi:MAG TPA: gamma-glutamylcyclotransferase family protein [Verrucomicrobiales bacterium]|nr:gamma-glutamylcyclotransferase family protein [Verrucomicrobiales bacterium]
MNSRVLLFVYGTLKRGFPQHSLLGEDAVFRGAVRTEPSFGLVDCGGFPGLVEAEPGQAVRGELWEVSEALLPALDTYEGVPEGEYVRLRTAVQPSPPGEGTVWAYHYSRETGTDEEYGAEWTAAGLQR